MLQRIPLFKALRGHDRAAYRDDMVAGLTTAVMLVPQGMAYAMLAGLEPIVGLYASTIPLALYALFGTSKQLAVGPVAMVSLLVASAVGALTTDPATALAYAALVALMVGVLQLGMGVVKLGFLVRFLSHPVLAGFTSAAALIIGLSQLKHVLGVPLERSHHVHEILLQAVAHIGDIQPMTLGIAILSLVTLLGLKRIAPRFPRFLLVVVGGTAAVWGLGLYDQGVAIVGEVPAGLPTPALPALDFASIRALFPIALTIALVGFMESISVAKRFARENRYEVDADQELVALGVANIAAAFFRGYPITGGFSRTAVNGEAGARSGLAGLITSAIIALTLLFFTPLFHFLPKAVLASIIMSAVFGLVDVREAKHLWRVSRPDLAMMGVTFVATLTLGIEQGIVLGVVASLLAFVWRMSSPHVAHLGRLQGTGVWRKLERNPESVPAPGVLAVRLDAPLFFANTAFLKQRLGELEEDVDDLRAVVLDGTGIGDVDASGDALLHELVESWERRNVQVWLAGWRGPVRDRLDRSGLLAKVQLSTTVEEAVRQVEGPAPAEDLGDPKLRLVGGDA